MVTDPQKSENWTYDNDDETLVEKKLESNNLFSINKTGI
jgi:hypothetical protein